MKDAFLHIQGLTKHFDSVVALSSFSCTLNKREILGIVGPNGAGKTTLFNLISGLITPEGGHIFLDGKNLTSFPPHKIARLGVARTFQNLRLIGQLSVLDNVLLSFRGQSGERLSNIFFYWRDCRAQQDKNRRTSMALLKKVGLEKWANDRAEALSYGQQKLLSIVCCLAADADLLLLDEPVAGIAPEMIGKILGVIKRLPKQGKSVMLIEHNLDAVMEICDRVVFMDAGSQISIGTPEQIRNDPRVIETYIG